jgi:hypothetical protein
MAKKVKKHDGRTSDLTFKWMLTTLGPEWEQWQELAAEWMATQHVGVDQLSALSRFLSPTCWSALPMQLILVCFSRAEWPYLLHKS